MFRANEVTIKQGALRGTFETSSEGKAYVSFKGIPYAKPPLGDLRFRVLTFFHVSIFFYLI